MKLFLFKVIPLLRRMHNRGENKRLKIAHLEHLLVDLYKHSFNSCDFIENVKSVDGLHVSLTSYGTRIDNCYYTIVSLLRQSVRPESITLYLAHGEKVPKRIQSLCNTSCLRICFVEDMKSYKKFIPAMIEMNSDDLLITADDDILYPVNYVESLYKAYMDNPNVIHCLRAHYIKKNIFGAIKPYRTWEYETNRTEPSHRIFPTTGAGLIFKRDFFDDEFFNLAVISELCPTADDIWFKVMAIRRDIKCQILRDCSMNEFITTVPDIENSLAKLNVIEGRNDVQLSKALHHYNILL